MKTVRCVTGSSYLSPFSEGAYHLLACKASKALKHDTSVARSENEHAGPSGPSGLAELSRLHNGVKQVAYCQQLISAPHSIPHYNREHIARGMMWIFS